MARMTVGYIAVANGWMFYFNMICAISVCPTTGNWALQLGTGPAIEGIVVQWAQFVNVAVPVAAGTQTCDELLCHVWGFHPSRPRTPHDSLTFVGRRQYASSSKRARSLKRNQGHYADVPCHFVGTESHFPRPPFPQNLMLQLFKKNFPCSSFIIWINIHVSPHRTMSLITDKLNHRTLLLIRD